MIYANAEMKLGGGKKKDTDTCTFLQITSVNKTHSK